MKPSKIALVGFVGLSGVAGLGPGLTAAAAHGATQSCGPAHRYIDAASATVGAHRVTVTGKRSTLKCGGPDDYSYVDGGALTLKVLKTATIRVWRMPDDPSQGRKTIAATDLPKWLKKNRGEPVYKITGPVNGVTKLVEEWHP